MINWNELEGGKYLSAKNLPNGRLALTINGVCVEDVGTPAAKKAVVYGREDPRGLVLNATRRTVLRDAFGDDDGHWEGRRILITIGRGMFQGKSVEMLVVQPLTDPKRKPAVADAPVTDDSDWAVVDAD